MAVSLTSLAIIVHHAHRQGFWEDVGLHWRAPWHASVVRHRGRVATNVLVRDLDIPVPVNDGRSLEVVVDGLPLFGGAQLAVDTTLVSSLHCDGSPHKGAADVDGAVLVAAR